MHYYYNMYYQYFNKKRYSIECNYEVQTKTQCPLIERIEKITTILSLLVSVLQFGCYVIWISNGRGLESGPNSLLHPNMAWKGVEREMREKVGTGMSDNSVIKKNENIRY